MRQGSNPRRSRGRGPRKPQNFSRPQNFDNSGSDMRVRGNAYQVMEKYLAMARDASAAGDRIAMENYLQHAEHYYRMLNANGDPNRNRPVRVEGNGSGHHGAGNGFDGQAEDDGQGASSGQNGARGSAPGESSDDQDG
jgi:Domain of unknown function (DUF4167)